MNIISRLMIGLYACAFCLPVLSQAQKWNFDDVFIVTQPYKKSLALKDFSKESRSKNMRAGEAANWRHAEAVSVPYLRWMQNYGLRSPHLSHITTAKVPKLINKPSQTSSASDKHKLERRGILFYMPFEKADKSKGEYDMAWCDSKTPRDSTAHIKLNKTHFGTVPKTTAERIELKSVILHELMHGIIHRPKQVCTKMPWFDEGLSDGIAWYLLKKENKKGVEEYMKSDKFSSHELYGWRNYTIPLDLGADAKPYLNQDKKKKPPVLHGLPVSSVHTPYNTSSFFSYLLEATNESSLVREFAHTEWRAKSRNAYSNRPTYYALSNQYLRRPFNELLAGFYTEFASYGGSRYRHFSDHPELSKGGEAEQRRLWTHNGFNCPDPQLITIDGRIAGRRGASHPIAIQNIHRLAARCIRVKWEHVKNPMPLTFQFWVDSEIAARSLALGVAYLSGAAVNDSKLRYCFKSITAKKQGAKTKLTKQVGLTYLDKRAYRAPARKCLLMPEIATVQQNGVKKFQVKFTTKFHIGKTKGEANFILTNAPPNIDRTDGLPSASERLIKLKGKVSYSRIGGKRAELVLPGEDNTPLTETIITPSEAYLFGHTRLIDHAAMISPVQKSSLHKELAEANEGGWISTISNDEYTLSYFDSPDLGQLMFLISRDGQKIATSQPIDSCDLGGKLTVKSLDLAGLEMRFNAPIINIQKMMRQAIQNPEMDSCTLNKTSVEEVIEFDIFLPDGSLRASGFSRKDEFFPEQEQWLRESRAGIYPDIGGLPISVSSGSTSPDERIDTMFANCLSQPEIKRKDCMQKVIRELRPSDERERDHQEGDSSQTVLNGVGELLKEFLTLEKGEGDINEVRSDIPSIDKPILPDGSSSIPDVVAMDEAAFKAKLGQLKKLVSRQNCACTCAHQNTIASHLSQLERALDISLAQNESKATEMIAQFESVFPEAIRCTESCFDSVNNCQ